MSRLNSFKAKQLFLPVLAAIFAFTMASANTVEKSSTGIRHQVVIAGFEFVPKVLKVSPGDTVTWVNKDIVPHNIVTRDGQKAVSPDLAVGEKFTYVVKGALSYECGFHPSMKGKLVTP